MKAHSFVALCASPLILAAAVSAQTPPAGNSMAPPPEAPAVTTPAQPDHAAMGHAAPAGAALRATLTGAAEVPGPGDTDGGGAATVRVDPAQNQVCYTLTVTGIDTATAAHIHTGATGAAGPVAVPFDAPADGSSEGCATVAPALAQALTENPGGYYVNVHTAAFPNGAVRGQLGR